MISLALPILFGLAVAWVAWNAWFAPLYPNSRIGTKFIVLDLFLLAAVIAWLILS